MGRASTSEMVFSSLTFTYLTLMTKNPVWRKKQLDCLFGPGVEHLTGYFHLYEAEGGGAKQSPRRCDSVSQNTSEHSMSSFVEEVLSSVVFSFKNFSLNAPG